MARQLLLGTQTISAILNQIHVTLPLEVLFNPNTKTPLIIQLRQFQFAHETAYYSHGGVIVHSVEPEVR